MSHIMIPPGRMNVTRTSRDETLKVCQKICDRLWAKALGCKAVAIHTREWETQCVLCSSSTPDDEIQTTSAFYSRDTDPDEGGVDYCADCQIWIEHQDRLCDKICSHNFIDIPTPHPTSEAWRKWTKLTHEGMNWATDKIGAGAEYAQGKIRDSYPEYYDQAVDMRDKAYEYGNQAYGHVSDKLDSFGPWPTPQPTADPWQLQRCEGCHLDRAEMIQRCEARNCRLKYPTDSWHKPELQFTTRPSAPPTPEPTKEPTQEPSLHPTKYPTHPPVHAPTPGTFPDFPGNDPYGGKNLNCLDCLRKTGEMVSKEAQGCWVSETVCQNAPDKVIKEASKCLSLCQDDS